MKPVLLLAPGMLADASLWTGVAAELGNDFDLRIADLTTAPSIAAMADAAWQLLSDVPAATPVVLVGFSLGGYVVIEMLARPQRPLAAAALLSTSARPETAEGRIAREKSIRALQSDFGGTVAGIAKWGTAAAGPDLLARLERMMTAVGSDTAVRQVRAIMERADHRPALARLSLPVQVLCGVADRITPPALSQELAALIPGAQLQEVEGAGHMLPCEQPRAVAHALQRLIASRPFLDRPEVATSPRHNP